MKSSNAASELSKSYVSINGKLVLDEPPLKHVVKTANAILKELPTSVISMVAAMFLTQLYLLFYISQALLSPTYQARVKVSLFLFVMLGVFICIAFKLGWSLVTEKEEALRKAALLRKARSLQKN
ncbi:hypothetical protein DR864_24965 [Runella rosea]|uniref:Uncharacterized protein n=1 Tax=Runella rosea TaxID=2259595 RepID=A0A344TQ31_9BACT|nr:hypothetical protein [Runella rosea]AXE20752.1 hypothetical protein DR864_24965 [Runella rosea]